LLTGLLTELLCAGTEVLAPGSSIGAVPLVEALLAPGSSTGAVLLSAALLLGAAVPLVEALLAPGSSTGAVLLSAALLLGAGDTALPLAVLFSTASSEGLGVTAGNATALLL
jgi:hypothetical protein